MRMVVKDFEKSPAKLLCEGSQKQIQSAIEMQDGEVYTTTYYKDITVIKELNALYKKKCAYCESKIDFAATLQVEHYRPKAKLESVKTTDRHHKGYYWLGNEWTNLVLSCPKCNQNGAKGNKFPIQGVRHFADSPFDSSGNFSRANVLITNAHLKNEQPLLLNPGTFEEDMPENHFTFDRFSYMTGITPQGSKTIELCKLNREDLCLERLTKLNELLEDIKVVIQGLTKGKLNEAAVIFLLETAFDKIKNSKNDTESYTLWAKHFYTNFEDCFISRLDINYQATIKIAFEQYQNGTL
ncbi:MAG: hypothetical protein ACKVTZ_23020 [Bacteroidia bacterium]